LREIVGQRKRFAVELEHVLRAFVTLAAAAFQRESGRRIAAFVLLFFDYPREPHLQRRFVSREPRVAYGVRAFGIEHRRIRLIDSRRVRIELAQQREAVVHARRGLAKPRQASVGRAGRRQ
jgi:hypothetical protein